MTDHVINQLFAVLEERKEANPETSYVAQLYNLGTPKIAQKVGEEAVETVIEAMRFDQKTSDSFLEESADLVFHLLVLWAHLGVTPDQVFGILEKRMGVSGLNRTQ